MVWLVKMGRRGRVSSVRMRGMVKAERRRWMARMMLTDG
jgi:hypothetical protein